MMRTIVGILPDVFFRLASGGHGKQSANPNPNNQEQLIMSRLQNLQDGLAEIDAKVTKIAGETASAVAKIDELKAQLAEMDIPQDVLDKVEGISGHLSAIDSLIPDTPADPAAAA